MNNPDNKTKVVNEINLTKYRKLIEQNPCHIATISPNGKPNLAVASDIKVLDETHILISNNEMIHTPDNIIVNKNVVLTSFNSDWAGIRLTGTAEYLTKGTYMDLCNKYFLNETATPKGAIVITIEKVEGIA